MIGPNTNDALTTTVAPLIPAVDLIGIESMAGCVLRVTGSAQNVQTFLKSTTWAPIKIYRRGEPVFKTVDDSSVFTKSGFNVLASEGEGLERQAQGAIKFLAKHKKELLRLRKHKLKQLELDFQLYYIESAERPWPSYKLSQRLIEQCSYYGLEIRLSFYGRGNVRDKAK
jgi:hypothetical protein